ncbi:Hypothetical protein POVN_LOCUS615 [uncultured virus]|nr:Hypothetical protein POVN_LOCUS615 [uncultured virus]
MSSVAILRVLNIERMTDESKTTLFSIVDRIKAIDAKPNAEDAKVLRDWVVAGGLETLKKGLLEYLGKQCELKSIPDNAKVIPVGAFKRAVEMDSILVCFVGRNSTVDDAERHIRSMIYRGTRRFDFILSHKPTQWPTDPATFNAVRKEQVEKNTFEELDGSENLFAEIEKGPIYVDLLHHVVSIKPAHDMVVQTSHIITIATTVAEFKEMLKKVYGVEPSKQRFERTDGSHEQIEDKQQIAWHFKWDTGVPDFKVTFDT